MPVYLYECDVCGKRYELQRHFGDPHPSVCPEGHTDLHRVFSPPVVIFKGSGFYVTDNGSNNGRARPAESKTESSIAEKAQKPEKEGTAAKTEGKTNGGSDAR